MNNQKTLSSLKRLWSHLSPIRQRQFYFLLVLMVLVSFAEILSISAVLPFLAVLSSPETIFGSSFAAPFINFLQLTEPDQLLLPVTVVFSAAAFFAGAMRLLLLWLSTRLSFSAGSDLSIDIYRRTLYQPYSVHCERNSSEVINGISVKANAVIYNTILPFLTLISSSIMLISISSALFILEPVISLIAFSVLALIYIVIIRATRKQLLLDSKSVSIESTQVIKSLQEGLGGIRDVLIDGSQEVFSGIYRNADLSLRRSQGNTQFIAHSPRFVMEALGMILIAGLAYSLAIKVDGINNAIPILGTLALGAQRLLPILQHGYNSWSVMKGGQYSLEDTLKLLDQPISDYATQSPLKKLPFSKSITFVNVNFQYKKNSPFIIKGLNLKIRKGSRVGVVGETGSGKSTMIDILMGLLTPTDGSLCIDNNPISATNIKSWRSHIAHVPQFIFLSDASIRENIAFGVPNNKIDFKKVKLAAKQAQIADTIEEFEAEYETFVGEGGVRLSGGQRQRIGIARALYKNADVIIFDEATSSLDNDTESAVMESIEGLSKNLTLIIIAHRLSILKNCSEIIEIKRHKPALTKTKKSNK